MCPKHYQRAQREGFNENLSIRSGALHREVCIVDGCDNENIAARGLCTKHYKRARRNGFDSDLRKKTGGPDKENWDVGSLAWLAGIIEGEGYLASSGDPRIRVRMTDVDIVYKCKKVAGCGVVNGPYERDNPKWKPTWEWSVNTQCDIKELLEEIIPILGDRRTKQAKEVLELCP